MSANDGPYRVAETRPKEPLPLQPEEEMRLVLERGSLPRGRGLVFFVIVAVLSLGSLVAGIATRDGRAIAGFMYAFPLFVLAAFYWKYRRHVRRLREAGYDVAAFEAASKKQKQRVSAGEEPMPPHVRVDVDPAVAPALESFETSEPEALRGRR